MSRGAVRRAGKS